MTSRLFVIQCVRFPRTSQDKRHPIKTLPAAIHNTLRPKPQPSLPANPIKSTAEKYVVPYANAETHGPSVRPPRKKSFSVDVFFIPQYPIASDILQKAMISMRVTMIKFLS
jgi:hypothetical protein